MPIPTDNDVAAFIAEIKKWFNPIELNNRPKISKWKWNFYELTTPDTYRLISTALYTNNMSIVSDKNIKLTILQGAGQVLQAATYHFTPRPITYVQPVLYLSTTDETEYKFPVDLTSDNHPLDISIVVDSNDYVHGDVTINFGEAFNSKLVEVIVPPNDYPPNYLIPAGCNIKSVGNWTGSTISDPSPDFSITVPPNGGAWNIGNQEIRFVGVSHAEATQKPDYFQILNSTGVVLETVSSWTAFNIVSWLPGDTIDFKYKNSNTV